jgi:hypothetical protein
LLHGGDRGRLRRVRCDGDAIAPAALLHGSLALRLWVGDAHGAHLAWQVGGALNITAVLLFAGVAAWSSMRAAHKSDAS